jgi:hypothetical protein
VARGERRRHGWKTSTRRVDGSDPAFVFEPLGCRAEGHAAIVWVTPMFADICVFSMSVRRCRRLSSSRRSIAAASNCGPALCDAIDYGGAGGDDVLTAVDYLKANVPQVDQRIGIAGWSPAGSPCSRSRAAGDVQGRGRRRTGHEPVSTSCVEGERRSGDRSIRESDRRAAEPTSTKAVAALPDRQVAIPLLVHVTPK